MNIHVSIPWAEDSNLGGAYNRVLEMLPDDGWAVFLDHDAMFTTGQWYHQIKAAIELEPEGTFVARTNRVGQNGNRTGWQRLDIDPDNHDIRKHRQIGADCLKFGPWQLFDVTNEVKLAAGVLLVI